ncbi:MAG TPA: LuxR C-terminal-related transcriptional regulator [Kineosporiaceae bacterium]
MRHLLSRSPLVTLIGVGGVGKTRLATQVASTVRRAFDGVLGVDCEDVPAEQSVVGALAPLLGLDVPPGGDPGETLVEALRGRRMLLLFDTCATRIEEVAALAHLLLRTCPTLRLLASSREPLRVAGEATLIVPPLEVPAPGATARELAASPAVALYLARSGRGAGDVVPPAGDAHATGGRGPVGAQAGTALEAVAVLCRRVDGLPLALELAAQVDIALDPLPPLDAVDPAAGTGDRGPAGAPAAAGGADPRAGPDPELEQQAALYRALNRGVDAPVARHRTIRDCFAWSRTMCTPAERLLWARLSVFRGSFELDDIEAVCADDQLPAADLLDVVVALVDKSVLTRQETGSVVRYRLLGLVQAFGAEELERLGERDRAHRRHRDHYLELAQRFGGEKAPSGRAGWLARWDERQPDVRAALRAGLGRPGLGDRVLTAAIALCRYWIHRDQLAEGALWLGAALDTAPEPSPARTEGLLALALLAAVRGDLTEAQALRVRAGPRPGPGTGREGGRETRPDLVTELIGLLGDSVAGRAGSSRDLEEAVAQALGEPLPAPAAPCGGDPAPVATAAGPVELPLDLGAGRPCLTRREAEVADLVGQGLTNRQIADRLVIAQRTAEGHVESIMVKLGVSSRTQVASWLAQQLDRPGRA